jgi:hypothetical protein
MSRRLKLTLFPLLFIAASVFAGGSVVFGDDLASTDVAPLSTTAGANTTYTITFDNSDQAAPPPVNTPIPANGFISVEFPSGTDASNVTAANVVFTSADGLTLGSVISFANTVLIYSTSAQDGSNSYVVTFTISNVNNLTTAGGPYNTTKIETYNSSAVLLDESFDDSVGFIITTDVLNYIVIEDTGGVAGNVVTTHTMTTDAADDYTVFAAGYDQYGNYIADQSVTWSFNDTYGAVFEEATDLSTTSGISTVFQPNNTGVDSIHADDGVRTDDTGDITVSPGAATQVVVSVAPADIVAGGTTTLTVEVQDAEGNLVTSDNATVITFDPTLSGTISGVVTGTLQTAPLGVPGDAEGVQVAGGVATVVLTDTVVETFDVAMTSAPVLTNPGDSCNAESGSDHAGGGGLCGWRECGS